MVDSPFLSSHPPLPLMGIHVADSGNAGDLLGVVYRSAKAGKPVPFCMVVNDGGLVSTIKSVSPLSLVAFRPGVTGDDYSPFGPDGWGDGTAWVNKYKDAILGVPANWHQLYNEVSFGGNMDGVPRDKQIEYTKNVAATELMMMIRADALGVKLAIGNYTAGVPDPALFGEYLAPVWDYAAANGHAANFHWYSYANGTDRPRNMSSRVEYMLTRFLDYYWRWPSLQILIGEFGLFDTPRWTGEQLWVEGVSILRPYQAIGQKIAVASWTIKAFYDPKWKLDDWTDQLPIYERYLMDGRL